MPCGREVGSAVPGPAMLESAFAQVGRGARPDSFRGASFPAGIDLVQQATTILAREAAGLPAPLLGGWAAPGLDGPLRAPLAAGSGVDVDRLRRYAHEIVETLLSSFGGAFSGKGPADDRVPLLRCAAPVEAGKAASISLRVTNEEATPSEVSLYCTNFVGDTGYEIPSVRVGFSPRVSTIAGKSEGSFEITIAVPPQTPPGLYSGLVQAAGSKYVKSVVSVEVR